MHDVEQDLWNCCVGMEEYKQSGITSTPLYVNFLCDDIGSYSIIEVLELPQKKLSQVMGKKSSWKVVEKSA